MVWATLPQQVLIMFLIYALWLSFDIISCTVKVLSVNENKLHKQH